jgi:hypothetical protein
LGVVTAVVAASLWVRGCWSDDTVSLVTLREESLSRRDITYRSSRGRLYVVCATTWHNDRAAFLRDRAHYASLGSKNDRIVRWTRSEACDPPQLESGGRPDFLRWGFLWDDSVGGTPLAPTVLETTSFMVPYWFVIALAGFAPAARLARRTRKSLRVRLAARRGLCAACGYDLRATPGRCPECGTDASQSPAPAPAGQEAEPAPPARAA